MAWCRQQAIITTNVDPVLCRHMASPGHNELSAGPLVITVPADGLAPGGAKPFKSFHTFKIPSTQNHPLVPVLITET